MERGSAEEWARRGARRRGCVFICKRGGSIIIPASKCPFVARFLDSSRPTWPFGATGSSNRIRNFRFLRRGCRSRELFLENDSRVRREAKYSYAKHNDFNRKIEYCFAFVTQSLEEKRLI